MKRDDWILLSLTFFTGLAIGMYVYVTVFKPTYQSEDLRQTEAEASEWSVVGKRRIENDYSGAVQPSFRLLGDGSYVYLPGGSGDDALIPREGRLSRATVQQIRTHDHQLAAYTAEGSSPNCGQDGGFDHEYRITLEDRTYFLDSCYTALGSQTPLAVSLAIVWNEIEGKKGGQRFNSFSDWAENWIRDNIGVKPGD